MKKILMIAYHFPPFAGSSGVQRTLRFVQHLPGAGWQPIVLSVQPRAYEQVSDDLLADIPRGTVVERAFALDTARHLQWRGRYFGAMARPDRWMTWRFAAVRQGLKLIARHRPDVIWSTYPIATAHVIGHALCRRTGIPWVADFRDPMAQDGYPADPLTRQAYLDIEASVFDAAKYAVFTTPGAAQMYRERYPQAPARIAVVQNGYDEESFTPPAVPGGGAPAAGRVTLLHSGVVYPSERDPTQFFEALKRCFDAGTLKRGEVLIRFRASGHDGLLTTLAERCGLQDSIELAAPVPYRAALSEMQTVDALLVMQAANCNAQIPAKIYEYLRAGRPLLGLADRAGDTAAVLRASGIDAVADLDSVDDIAALLPVFVDAVRRGTAKRPDAGYVQGASRRGRAAELVGLLDAAASDRP